MSKGEYRVVHDNGHYWVQFVDLPRVSGGSYGPHGSTIEELLEDWTNFNQALHKPVIDMFGREIEPPVVKKKPKEDDDEETEGQ